MGVGNIYLALKNLSIFRILSKTMQLRIQHKRTQQPQLPFNQFCYQQSTIQKRTRKFSSR